MNKRITKGYTGSGNVYYVELDGEPVYQTKDSRDADLFVAQLMDAISSNGNKQDVNKFRIIEVSDPGKFEEFVSDHLRKGYHLHGSPFKQDGYFYQALKK